MSIKAPRKTRSDFNIARFRGQAIQQRTLASLTILMLAVSLALSLLSPVPPTRAAGDINVGGSDVSVFSGCNEPMTAAVNPLNPQNVVVAECNSIAISNDFGRTWPVVNNLTVPATLASGGYGSCGDAALAFDSAGRLFWNYLVCNSTDTTVVVSQINLTTGGPTGSNAIDLTADDTNDDKSWIAGDNNFGSPYRDNLYVVWSRLTTNQIMFSRSTNNGATWSAPRAISGSGEGFVWPSHVAVAPNGDLYVAYHSDTCGSATASMFVIRDSTGGANLAAGTISQKTSFASAVTCNVQGTTGSIAGSHFWMQGAQAPYILPDPNRPGTIYVVANDDTDDNFSSGDPGDVILVTSTDYGNSWSKKTVSHAPSGTLQAFPTGAIDKTGNIVLMWYDNRRQLLNNGPDNTAGTADDYFNLDIFATVSRDGGNTFSNDFRVNDQPFDPDLNAPCRFGCGGPGDPPPATLRIGEYNGLAAANGVGYFAFTGNATGSQQLLFDLVSITAVFPDRFEPNDSASGVTATDLGAFPTYSQGNLTISDDTDEDFFKITALNTGKLSFQIDYNSRFADLDIQVRDSNNQPVTTSSTGLDTNNTESITIPAVAGQVYYLRVYADPGAPNPPTQTPPVNTYNLNITNTPAPTPFGLALAPGSDSGTFSNDNLTNVSNPTLTLQLNQGPLAGLSFSAGSNPASDPPGYKVAIYTNGLLAGYASQTSPSGLYSFSFAGPLADGTYNVTARVVMVDPKVGSHAFEAGDQSAALQLTIDTSSPATPGAPELLASSDSGSSTTDHITNINAPAFKGIGEANAKVRVFARLLPSGSPVLVGQGFVGTDNTDGVPGDGKGAWEITVEPLADGTYEITVELEDLAGNISSRSAPLSPNLVIDTIAGGGKPQRPTIDLVDADDTGRSNLDNVTSLTTLRFRVSAEIGSQVAIKDGNTIILTYTQAAAFDTITLTLGEGPHPLSAESTDTAGNRSDQAEQLVVTVDTTAPLTGPAPDLQASSDTGGINDDNITTLSSPTFQGQAEPNSLVRLFAGGLKVGQGLADASSGLYQLTVGPLADGVYQFTITQEDLAGNVSLASGGLKVTIAHQSLSLAGGTSGLPGGLVTVDLGAGTISGYPGLAGASGKAGIAGIPVVFLDLNNRALTVLGTAGDDNLTYNPTGTTAGNLALASSGQLLYLSNVGGTFTLDPAGGNDTVQVNGTASSDTINVNADTLTTAQVNTLLKVSMPVASVERLAVSSGQGADFINVTAYNTVNAFLFVDAGDPSSNPPNGDTLKVIDGSGKAQLQNQPGGPVAGSGSFFVTYPKTAGKPQTRIDYANVEKIVKG